MNYSESGVDIEAGDNFVAVIKTMVQSTHDARVVESIGGFCSLYRSIFDSEQLIAASTDGVGSKIMLAKTFKDYGYLKTIGQDLVGMVFNDILTCGAVPMFMLDYYAVGNLRENYKDSIQILEGISEACVRAKVALIGGETSEMTAVYGKNNFDLAGFGIGMVYKNSTYGAHLVKEGDYILGLESSGPHSNGYSLIQKLFPESQLQTHSEILAALMEPTELYTDIVAMLRSEFDRTQLHAMAHITGGGLEHNTQRSVPKGLKAMIDWDSWKRPYIFTVIKEHGSEHLPEDEMRMVFNCGIGYTLIVKDDLQTVQAIQNRIRQMGKQSHVIGRVRKL